MRGPRTLSCYGSALASVSFVLFVVKKHYMPKACNKYTHSE